MAMFIVKPWYRKKDDAIYGAEWAGTSSPAWTRTDAAVGFASPNPYYAGMSTTPSSPFDNIMPWSGMRRVTDASAGELVEIPKFYYKWTRDGVKMKLQISMSQFDGSHVSPAHADRGDGVGERDYVYVGRYHCSTNNYKSTSGVLPKVNITRATARTNIHNLGSNVWQNDYALFWTIRTLYLVEFANWDAQTKIGYGCSPAGVIMNMGYTDSMPYHTGTDRTSRTTYGGTQYRYIEGLWDNVYDFCDGIAFTSNSNIYCQKNPNYFSDNVADNVLVDGRRVINDQGFYIKSYTQQPTQEGYEYAIMPNSIHNFRGYVANASVSSTGSSIILFTGGSKDQGDLFGMFTAYHSFSSSTTLSNLGSRLMVLPPSRLSA